MAIRKTSLERAFELARTGKYRDVTEILRQLKREKLPDLGIVGPALRSQLVAIINEHTPKDLKQFGIRYPS